MTENRTPDEDNILQQFGDWLRTIRKDSNLSQEELAEKAGFSRSYYTEIETGKRNISLLNLHRLAQALNVEPTDLLLFATTKTKTVSRLPRTPANGDFLDPPELRPSGLTIEMVKGGLSYAYSILDAMDDTLLSGNSSRIAEIVELANLSSMVGNLLGAGIAKASLGVFERNGPHKYPDLLAKHSQAQDIEIKVALETNKPKGHLAKEGYYLIFRYVLCDVDGKCGTEKTNRGNIVSVWESRFGWLDISDFNISNTEGDSGKTAVINADGMNKLKIIYCNLENCPYSRQSRTYREYERLFAKGQLGLL